MGKRTTRPEWAERLEHFRKDLGWSQAALARKLNVSPMATSRWERGVNQPTAAIYIRLGKLAHNSDRWYFWEKAGLTRGDIQPEPKISHSPSIEFSPQQPQPAKELPNLVAVPLYMTYNSPSSGNIHPEEKPSDFVVVPREWCANPDSTICLRIHDNHMYPVMQDGTTFGVDLLETDPEKLRSKLVLASHPENRVIVRWLQRYGDSWVLVPENRNFSPDYLHAGWQIAGRVLWWFSKSA
jgi:transcriptional regulator with XRE-family HTH domain